jgi:pantetheine-phosphate adenylyltransferase
MISKAVYPGSFDPMTLGHVDIIRRIRKIFDEVTVLIADNSQKAALFTILERKQLIEEAFAGQSGIHVESFSGLTVDYMKRAGASVIVRGLRAVTDFEYELVMSNMNKKLAPDIETMIVFASPEFYYVSSQTVKEVAKHGALVSGLVSPHVEAALKAKFSAAKK